MQRRHFLNRLPLLASIPLVYRSGISKEVNALEGIVDRMDHLDPEDEEYWLIVREAYDIPTDRIDFNNAGIGTPCLQVSNAFIEESKTLTQLPSKRNNQLRKIMLTCHEVLAELTQSPTNQIAMCRNATEALATAIFGIPLKAGDEVVVGRYDYPNIFYAWKQREKRDGIILKYADFGPSPKNPEVIAKAYLKHITKRTRAIQITDLINYNGCRVPTRDIISQLPPHVRYRIVDAAQSFANTIDHISEFGASHVGVSLHKWLGSPLGTGLLYVHEDFIRETWPLYASIPDNDGMIGKFEHLGTLNPAVYPGILAAIAFHQKISLKRKSKRLMHLGDYCVDQMKSVPNISIHSPRHNQLKSNLILFSHKHLTDSEVHSKLWKDQHIHVTTSEWFGVAGVRISPNIFTSMRDIESLGLALKNL
jgi:selenocysteine lyase/cysteine desulfurase